MPFNDRVKFVAMVVLSLSITTAIVAGFQSFSYLLFASVVIVEFMLIVEISTPRWHNLRWIKRMRWLAVFGLVGLTGLAIQFLRSITMG